jgi:NAD(P)-dependent dehydrogenase (short-subunit alcohol dehydrogenase family)
MSETKKLQGKVTVITGGTTGIGLAAGRLFVKEAAYVPDDLVNAAVVKTGAARDRSCMTGLRREVRMQSRRFHSRAAINAAVCQNILSRWQRNTFGRSRPGFVPGHSDGGVRISPANA